MLLSWIRGQSGHVSVQWTENQVNMTVNGIGNGWKSDPLAAERWNNFQPHLLSFSLSLSLSLAHTHTLTHSLTPLCLNHCKCESVCASLLVWVCACVCVCFCSPLSLTSSVIVHVCEWVCVYGWVSVWTCVWMCVDVCGRVWTCVWMCVGVFNGKSNWLSLCWDEAEWWSQPSSKEEDITDNENIKSGHNIINKHCRFIMGILDKVQSLLIFLYLFTQSVRVKAYFAFDSTAKSS